MIRQAGGANDHPSTPTFLQLYKLLSIFSILKPPIYGNCSISNEPTPNVFLISISDIKAIYTNPNDRIEIQESIKKRLNSLIEHEEWDFNELVEHDYSLPEVTDCLIYYTTATVIKRIRRNSKCEICKTAFEIPIISKNNETDSALYAEPVSLFFEMTDDSQIPSPNKKLYLFLRQVEHSFQKHYNSSNVLELVITDVIQNKITFPCVDHAEEVISFIICLYIGIRMRQYAKLSNRDNIKKYVSKRKESKFYCT